MFYPIGPMTSLSEPVAAHDSEFKDVPVRRCGDGARFGLSTAARLPFDGGLAPDASNIGWLDALTGCAPLRPAEFVIVRLAQHLATDEGHCG